MEKVVTVIPAKLGSTRLPRKNILPLGGKPLLAWSVQAALDSGVCGEIMVSTESEEVAIVAKEAGAAVPFMRPEHLGRDPYGVADVCRHVLEEYQKQGKTFDHLMVLLPTAPFRTARDIKTAYTKFREEDVPFLASVSEFQADIFGAMVEDENGSLSPLLPEYFNSRERPTAYEVNGAIHIARVPDFISTGDFVGPPLMPFPLPQAHCVDIDTQADYEYAQHLQALQAGHA